VISYHYMRTASSDDAHVVAARKGASRSGGDRDAEMPYRVTLPDDTAALDAIDEATVSHGGDHGNQYTGGKSNNVTVAKTGNSNTYALRKLRRDRPDLDVQVGDADHLQRVTTHRPRTRHAAY